MAHTESYINSSLPIPANLPKNILGILKMLSDYDAEGAWWLYFDRLDDLWINSKNAIAVGAMSKKDWELLEDKYWIHAEKIYSKETKSEAV